MSFVIARRQLRNLKKPETKFRSVFVKKLKEIPHSFWESIQQKTINGTPDIIGCVRGMFVALELKASKNSKVSDLQAFKIEKIKVAFGFARVVSPENAEEVLKEIRCLNSNVPFSITQ